MKSAQIASPHRRAAHPIDLNLHPKLDGDTYLLNYARLELNDWTDVSIQSKCNALKNPSYIKWMILFIALASLIVTVLLPESFTRFLLRPPIVRGIGIELMERMKQTYNPDCRQAYENTLDWVPIDPETL